jgi:hypothetical protein
MQPVRIHTYKCAEIARTCQFVAIAKNNTLPIAGEALAGHKLSRHEPSRILRAR